jgi:cation:H+ antiporter
MLTYILFIVGFVLLIKGAGMLVDGSSSLARRFNVPPLVIGLTIVAFGTSAPEMIVSIFASFQGNTEIAIGNILGSNIANILLILGISALIYPVTAKKSTLWREIPFSLLAALAVGVLANDIMIDGDIFSALTRSDGLILLGFFVIFLYYIASMVGGNGEKEEVSDKKEWRVSKSIGYILIGLLALVVGGKWIVDGAVSVAEAMGISQSLIALTIVAVGTSLPELATSIVAAYKKESDIAIGNVIGSNIFNVFFILGTSAVIRPLPFSTSSAFDILMAVGASIILFVLLFVGKKMVVERWQGGLMVLVYVAYVAFLVMRG